ncbi:MHO_1580 family protein [Mycoplasma sp. 3398]
MFIAFNETPKLHSLENKQEQWMEEYIINAKQRKYLENWNSFNELTTIKIRRIIRSDKFIITFEHKNPLKEIEAIRVNGLINNKIIEFKPKYEYNSGHFILTYNSDNDSKNKLEFNDIVNINFEIEYKVKNLWYQAKAFTYWIKNNPRSKNINLNNTKAINVLSEIEIKSLPDRINKNIINHKFKTKYLNLFFNTNNLKQGIHNIKLLSLKIAKSDQETNEEYILDNSDIYDLTFSSANIYDYAKNKYDTKLSYHNFNNADLVIDTYSYYDKFSDTVMVNNQNLNAKLGILIPLKYKGTYGYEINLDIGKNLKSFKMSYSQEIEKPFFDINNGLIRMNTRSIKGWLTDEKWHKIKYDNFADVIKMANSLQSIEQIGGK